MDSGSYSTRNLVPAMQLSTDSTNNNTANSIELTFLDGYGWSKLLKAIKVENGGSTKTLTSDDYTVNVDDQKQGTITIKAGILIAGVNKLTIQSTGFVDATVFQQVDAENQAPTATNVGFAGRFEIGQTVTGTYTFSDPNGDLEGVSTYRWLRSDSIDGQYVAIDRATEKTYTLTDADGAKFIKFEVTPVDSKGLAGTPVEVRLDSSNNTK